jgi:uncharacterized RDD family membrane protein YckC
MLVFLKRKPQISEKQMADYFYAVNGQSNGPLALEQIDDMVRTGSLTPETLIWTENMPEWQPYAAVRGGAAPAGGGLRVAAAAPAGAVVCSVCGGTFPPDQVIQYGATQVCGGCKPQFLQRLREGAQVGGMLDYATFGRRFGAKILDTFIVYVVTFGMNYLVMATGGGNAQEANVGLALVTFILNFGVSFGYPIFFLGKWGQTLGKMAVGIKVVTPASEPIGYGRAAGRVLSEIVTGFTLGIGYLMVLWDAEKRALHDRMAGTRVVNVPKT